MKKKPKKHVKQRAIEYAIRVHKTPWGTMERAYIAGFNAALRLKSNPCEKQK